METTEPPTSTPRRPPVSALFQSMEEFMKEQDELDAAKSRDARAAAAAAAPSSKKARRAIDVEGITQEARALEEIGDANWIGRLLEYRAVHPPADGLKYLESLVGSSPSKYSCSTVLAESPQPFGDAVAFSKKKDAKQYASKKAIDWLIKNNYMPQVGVKFPKIVTPHPPLAKAKKSKGGVSPLAMMEVTGESGGVVVPFSTSLSLPLSAPPAAPPKQTTFAGQVPALCTRLGFTAPTYVITRASSFAPLYSGYAHFNGDPRIDGKVGEVTEPIHGQKNTKEKIAEELVSFLKDIERQRSELFTEELGKRKLSVETTDAGEVPDKVLKIEA